MIVLGINADQADASAALLGDGRLLAALEEERFTRIRHCASFPTEAIRRCLAIAGITGRDVDLVAMAGDPRANPGRRILRTLQTRPGPREIRRRFARVLGHDGAGHELAAALGLPPEQLPPIHHVEHHPAHLASAFYVSPFETAAVCSADGVGDLVTATIARGRGAAIEVLQKRFVPHSLGSFYTAITQFLGFPEHGDEYKVMGLAAYGEATFVDRLRRLVSPTPDGFFRLDRTYFVDNPQGIGKEGGRPRIPRLWSAKLESLLGPPRQPGEPIEPRHQDTARSLQAVFEDVLLHVLRAAFRRTGERNLCVAGGCFMNSALVGKILEETPFERLYVPPAAGDAGTALGAALALWHRVVSRERSFVLEHAYTGTAYTAEAIEAALRSRAEDLRGHRIERAETDDALCRSVARCIADGEIVGWFQGAMEWGSRALGNRSLLADPRRPDVRERINRQIKRREPFRPFAPSLPEEALGDWFDDARPEPFMLSVRPIRVDRRSQIPGVVHVDGSGRPHGVSSRTNPRFHRLLRSFEEITGVPVLLNTSLNENEPIVEHPAQALDCYLRTEMDSIALGDMVIRRPRPPIK